MVLKDLGPGLELIQASRHSSWFPFAVAWAKAHSLVEPFTQHMPEHSINGHQHVLGSQDLEAWVWVSLCLVLIQHNQAANCLQIMASTCFTPVLCLPHVVNIDCVYAVVDNSFWDKTTTCPCCLPQPSSTSVAFPTTADFPRETCRCTQI